MSLNSGKKLSVKAAAGITSDTIGTGALRYLQFLNRRRYPYGGIGALVGALGPDYTPSQRYYQAITQTLARILPPS